MLNASWCPGGDECWANGSVLNSPANRTAPAGPGAYDERPEFYYVPVLFAAIFVVGVLGNGTLVVIFVRHRNMRNVPNTYILSLALGDLLVIVCCVPFTSTIYTWPDWPFGEFVCKLSEAGKDVSVGVSVFTLTALSADRFFAIVDPIGKRFSSLGGGATGLTVFVAAAIWAVAAALAAPAAVNSHVRVVADADGSTLAFCYPFPDKVYAQRMVVARFLVYYAGPLAIVGFFYAAMARHLVLSTRNMPGEMQPPHARQIRARKKVAKTVLAFVVIFAVCFLPSNVFLLWFYHWPDAEADFDEFWNQLRIAGFCLSFLNSCINPIALYCVSGAFRKHFDRYLFRRRDRAGRDRSARPGGGGTRKWESTTLTLQPLRRSTLRRPPDRDCTVTTCANGAGESGV